MEGCKQLPASTPCTPRLPVSLLPSAGGGITIFEMCFDHQCSQKALTLDCPEMKGIRLGGKRPISIYRWYFVCIFHPLKMDIIKRLIPKAQSFEVFQMICWEKGGCGTFRTSTNLCHLPPSISFPFPLQKKKEKNLAFTTKQIQMLDNEWAEDRDCRNRTFSISQAGATQIAFTVLWE